MLFRLAFGVLGALIFWTNPTLLPFLKERYPPDEFDKPYGVWAVVCGASDGLGLEWSYALAERGLNVVMIGRNATRLNEAKEELSRAVSQTKYRAIALDLGNIDEWRRVATELADELEIGTVVHNAAYSPVGPFHSYSIAMHEQTVKLNVHSAVIAASIFLPKMVKRGRGAFILMSSADGEGCSPYVANYAGTKAWGTTFAESLWYEMRPHNVDVLGVVAGLTTTPSLDGVLDAQKRKMLNFLESHPRAVVEEALMMLGRGQPVVVTGLGTKIATWIRWILPRFIECHAMSSFKDLLKPASELEKFAKETLIS